MKRLHVHISVADLEQSIGFYSTLFAAQPAVRKPDYAKWVLEDPCVNFAISQRGREAGVDHLGIQVETPEELQVVRDRLDLADGPILDEGDVTCCYAESRKTWITDPSGIAWETFLTHGESAFYGDGQDRGEAPTARAVTPTVSPNSLSAPEPEAAPRKSACCSPSIAGAPVSSAPMSNRC